MTIQQKDNFAYLKKNAASFPWAESDEYSKTETVTTVETIRQFFIESAQRCTTATVEGITQATLDAAFSNALASLNESALETNYETKNNTKHL